MCTVTYVPLANDHFFFTTNRDEAPGRSPQTLHRDTLGRTTAVFPRDKGAGGTWIAVSADGRLACVINGAFEAHRHQPPYRRSRGLMALDFFHFTDAEQFARRYTFTGMEPFTLVIINQGQLLDLRWDGRRLHRRDFARDAYHIWSSPKLYPREIRRKREQWFAEWQSRHPHPGIEDVRHFHAQAGEGDPHNDVVMNRNNVVRTVSTTLIDASPQAWNMYHHELLSHARVQAQLRRDQGA